MDRLARTRRLLVIATLVGLVGVSVAYATSIVITAPAPAADFAVGIAPASAPGARGAISASSVRSSANVIVLAGRHARLRVAVAPRRGFSGRVRLSARRAPRGLRVRFSRRAVSRASPASTLTIAASNRAPRGTFKIVVDARGEHGSRVVRALVSVRHLHVRPRLVTITAGERASVNVSLRRSSARAPTRLSLSGLPAHAIGVFAPGTTTGSRATLQIATYAAGTPAGSSVLTVRSRSGANTSVARIRLRVEAPDRSPFAIAGSVTGLEPGIPRAINLTLTNPRAHALLITDLRIAIASLTAPGASAARPCGAADFAVNAYSGRYPLRLAAGASRTLAQLGVPAALWPRVTMLDRPVNQDGCKAAGLTFAYGGSATR